MSACLYRVIGTDGRLLYVGMSAHPLLRAVHHQSSKTWWKNVDRIEVEHFASRGEALTAEDLAILNENPEYNVLRRQASRIATLAEQRARDDQRREEIFRRIAEERNRKAA
jgi:hypothetical protein